MTTTLRPTAPLHESADGGRSRAYEVCVNGRPVGVAELGTHARFGGGVGQIRRLDIAESDRRRGRGTVAALAAEEVLRGWGCAQVTVSVPAEASAALALATALGYTARGHNMAKTLTEPPTLPPASHARPLTDAEYPRWFARERAGYIRSWVERGVSETEAATKADADYANLLPDGPATRDVRLRVLAHEDVVRGDIWLSLGETLGNGEGAYVFSVEVAPEHRGQGHGRTLLLIAEHESLAAGVTRLGLHVFANNTPAVRLYESLGYRYTTTHLVKPLL
ncbi:GNAT family N-acetyltransferase [Streptomyces sp. NPDC057702]|uniref:GNAT family N-acetyltransferase n=1 Tax=unclassified Streptomyces TaxID=2593676 RepID=UPI00369EA7CF